MNLKDGLLLLFLIALVFLVFILPEDVVRHLCIIVNPLLLPFPPKMV